MVYITKRWIQEKTNQNYQSRRMPNLVALNKYLAGPVLSEGWKEMNRGITTQYCQLDHHANYITSLAANGKDIAVGSGDPNGQLFFVKDKMDRLETQVQTQLNTPIYSLDWRDKRLLVGTNQCTVRLYDTQRQQDGLVEIQLKDKYQSAHMPDAFDAPPGRFQRNSHVPCVEFHPENHDLFLSTVLSMVEVWDVHRSQRSARSVDPDGEALNVARWCAAQPCVMAMAGNSGALHILDTRATENRGLVWQVHAAHARSITDAQFNPFVPYWLATADETGTVHVWDLRTSVHKPMATVSGHFGPVTSMSWGNTRPERLATTSADGSYRLWSITDNQIGGLEDLYLLGSRQVFRSAPEWLKRFEADNFEQRWWESTMGPEPMLREDDLYTDELDTTTWGTERVLLSRGFGIGEWGRYDVGQIYWPGRQRSHGPVVKCAMSTVRPGLSYCVTQSGQLCSQFFCPAYQSSLDIPHAYSYGDDRLSYQITKSIHLRLITRAKNLIQEMETKATGDNAEKIKERIDKFNSYLKVPPKVSSEWAWDSIPDPSDKKLNQNLWTELDRWQYVANQFIAELKDWQCRVAPGCDQIFPDIPVELGSLLPFPDGGGRVAAPEPRMRRMSTTLKGSQSYCHALSGDLANERTITLTAPEAEYGGIQEEDVVTDDEDERSALANTPSSAMPMLQASRVATSPIFSIGDHVMSDDEAHTAAAHAADHPLSSSPEQMQQPLLPSCTFPSGKHVSSYAPSSPSVASDTVGSPPRRYTSLDSPKSTRTKRSATAGDELDAHLSSPMVISTPPETPQDIKHHSHFHLPKTKSLKRIFTLHRIPSKKSLKESLRRSNSSASMKGSPVSPGGATPPPIPDPHASPNKKKPQM